MSDANVVVPSKEPLSLVLGKLDEMQDKTQRQIDELKAQTEALTAAQASHLEALESAKQNYATLRTWADEQDRRKPVGQKTYDPMAGRATADVAVRDEFARWCLDIASFRIDGAARGFSESFKRTQSEGSTSGGGYLVHPEQAQFVTQLIEKYGAARRLCRAFPMQKNEMRVPTLVTRPTVYWPGESTAPNQSAVAFGRPAITAKKLVAIDSMSLEVDEDAVPMLRDFIPDVFAIAVAKEEDKQAFVGDTGNSDPFDGLLKISGVQELVLANGQDTYAEITYDDLISTMNTVSAHALLNANCKWLMSTSMALALRKVKDSQNRPLWGDMSQGDPNTLFGFPIVRSEVMPATSDVSQADKPFLLFGDFSFHAMGIRNDLAVDFSRDVEFKEAAIVMRVMERIGFQLLIGTAIARVKTHS